jgi:hypothetical protein
MPTATLPPPSTIGTGPICPFRLTVEPIGALLNCEIADHPVYDALELQAFDDDEHGRGLLAFLSRRGSRVVDYYVEPGLRLDPTGYQIGGGTGMWVETSFDAARLVIDADGVDAEVRFIDVDGRTIEVRVDDHDGKVGRRARLLAPVSAGIDEPGSLLLVLMGSFDLAHRTDVAPVVRIDGDQVRTGHLPGAALHRRHLIKYAADIAAVCVNPTEDGPARHVDPDDPDGVTLAPDRSGIVAVHGSGGGHEAVLALHPPLPDLRTLCRPERGEWNIAVDGETVTGGTWSALPIRRGVLLILDVTERWVPGPLPPLMRTVTTLLPMFRRWPTTYRWVGNVHADGEQTTITARWVRKRGSLGQGYRRVTGSA